MNKSFDKIRLVRTAADILISVMLTVSGVLFAVSCYSVYRSGGKNPFTYESIGAAFNKIQIIVYITLALVAVGGVLATLFPSAEATARAPRRVRSVYERLAQRVDIAELPEGERVAILRERGLRSKLFYANIAIITLEAVLPLFFLLDPNTFPASVGAYNSEVLSAFLLYICMLAPLAVTEPLYFVLTRRSYARETESLKSAMKGGNVAAKVQKNDGRFSRIRTFFSENDAALTLGARIAFVGCAIVFIVIGILNGGMGDVLIKAINICAECIGLG